MYDAIGSLERWQGEGREVGREGGREGAREGGSGTEGVKEGGEGRKGIDGTAYIVIQGTVSSCWASS